MKTQCLPILCADAGTIVDRVIENRGSPPADLLMTSTVHGAWRAAEAGYR